MFASQTPKFGQPSKATSRPRRWADPAARWLIAFGTLVFLLLMPGASHACANRPSPAPSAAQRVVSHATTRTIASSHVAAISSNRSGCCGEQSRHCGGAQAGSCCPGCTAGLFVTGYAFVRALPPRDDFFLLEMNFSPASLDKQFRPPRTAL